MSEEKRKLVVIGGSTAIGKTKLSIQLAKEIGGEIISADSMQVYRHMNIGTAKIKKEEMEHIPHHLLDVAEPWESFDVFAYQKLVRETIEDIYSRGKVPMLVGGTGFYIQAILYDINFTNNNDNEATRKELTDLLIRHGSHYLYRMLQEVDPEYAAAVHPNNFRRSIRAIEFYRLTGQKFSEHNRLESLRTSPYDFKFFVLTDEREKVYSRIEQRVDAMIEEGFVEEVKSILAMGCPITAKPLQGLGYKEIIQYLRGDYTLETAIYLTKRNTRHYAKRQRTWFRREKDVIWYDKSIPDMDDEFILPDMIRRFQNE